MWSGARNGCITTLRTSLILGFRFACHERVLRDAAHVRGRGAYDPNATGTDTIDVDPVPSTWTAILSHRRQSHVGTFRVKARVSGLAGAPRTSGSRGGSGTALGPSTTEAYATGRALTRNLPRDRPWPSHDPAGHRAGTQSWDGGSGGQSPRPLQAATVDGPGRLSRSGPGRSGVRPRPRRTDLGRTGDGCRDRQVQPGRRCAERQDHDARRDVGDKRRTPPTFRTPVRTRHEPPAPKRNGPGGSRSPGPRTSRRRRHAHDAAGTPRAATAVSAAPVVRYVDANNWLGVFTQHRVSARGPDAGRVQRRARWPSGTSRAPRRLCVADTTAAGSAARGRVDGGGNANRDRAVHRDADRQPRRPSRWPGRIRRSRPAERWRPANPGFTAKRHQRPSHVRLRQLHASQRRRR